MKYILIAILSIFLLGCGTIDKNVPAIQPKIVNLDSTALEPCSNLDENLSITSFNQFITVYGDLATLYGKCANKQSSSIKLLKQFGNIN